MNKQLTPLEALENIKRDLEYITRLDYVDPIVRGEVRDELYKIYHRELPELDILETALKDYEKNKELLKACEIANYNFKGDIKRLKDKVEQNAKKLKALEVLKLFIELETFNDNGYDVFFLKIGKEHIEISMEQFLIFMEVLDYAKR